MNRNIMIAKELVKLASNMIGHRESSLVKIFAYGKGKIWIYHEEIYKSNIRLHGQYVWAYDTPYKDVYTKVDCIVVKARGCDMKLYDSYKKFEDIGMELMNNLTHKRHIFIPFQAAYIGDYSPERMDKLVALITEVMGECKELK